MNDARNTTSPARKTDGRAWKFAVVKRMFGRNGMFDFPTAATFAALSDANAYAERFAREQGLAGVRGAEIVVRERGTKKWVGFYKSDTYRQEARS